MLTNLSVVASKKAVLPWASNLEGICSEHGRNVSPRRKKGEQKRVHSLLIREDPEGTLQRAEKIQILCKNRMSERNRANARLAQCNVGISLTVTSFQTVSQPLKVIHDGFFIPTLMLAVATFYQTEGGNKCKRKGERRSDRRREHIRQDKEGRFSHNKITHPPGHLVRKVASTPPGRAGSLVQQQQRRCNARGLSA